MACGRPSRPCYCHVVAMTSHSTIIHERHSWVTNRPGPSYALERIPSVPKVLYRDNVPYESDLLDVQLMCPRAAMKSIDITMTPPSCCCCCWCWCLYCSAWWCWHSNRRREEGWNWHCVGSKMLPQGHPNFVLTVNCQQRVSWGTFSTKLRNPTPLSHSIQLREDIASPWVHPIIDLQDEVCHWQCIDSMSCYHRWDSHNTTCS